jgi:S-adenosyl methyltransferase
MEEDRMTWAKVDPSYVPPEIDTSKPSVARVYDAILGGKDNFAADRAIAEEAVKASSWRTSGTPTRCSRCLGSLVSSTSASRWA